MAHESYFKLLSWWPHQRQFSSMSCDCQKWTELEEIFFSISMSSQFLICCNFFGKQSFAHNFVARVEFIIWLPPPRMNVEKQCDDEKMLAQRSNVFFVSCSRGFKSPPPTLLVLDLLMLKLLLWLRRNSENWKLCRQRHPQILQSRDMTALEKF